MKLLVKTTGSFMVYLPGLEQTVEADRPGVVRSTPFINRSMADKKLVVLHQLADSASDAEFLVTLNDSKGDEKLAVEVYASMHPYDDVAQAADAEKDAAAAEAKKPRRRKAAA